MARDWNPADTYIAACLRPFNTHREGREHERECPDCQRIIRGEPEELPMKGTKMLDIDTRIIPDIQDIRMRFRVKEDDLAAALSKGEARSLVNALNKQHGVLIFSDVAESVIDEFRE